MGYNPNILHVLVGCPAPRLVLLAGAYQRSNRDHLDWWFAGYGKKQKRDTLNPWFFWNKPFANLSFPGTFHPRRKTNQGSRVATKWHLPANLLASTSTSARQLDTRVLSTNSPWRSSHPARLSRDGDLTGRPAGQHGGIHFFKVRLVGGFNQPIRKILPSRELTYPTWGKGKSSSNMPFLGDMLIPWRVYYTIPYH